MEPKMQAGKMFLENAFSENSQIRKLERPASGWIRTIRESLGLSTTQTAERLGVSQPRIIALERGELKGSLTLQTIRKVATALDCTLVYALVPNQYISTESKPATSDGSLQKQQNNSNKL